MELSIVIPVYNEERIIRESLSKIADFCKKKCKRYEIIVVDDGSTDNTTNIVKKFQGKNVILLTNKENRGKGYSVRQGIQQAAYPSVQFSDADLATPIEDVMRLMPYLKGHDLVLASRNKKKSIILQKQPFFRRISGKIFVLLVQLLILPDFTDTQCGFKLFRTIAAKEIIRYQHIDRFSFDVELLLIAKKRSYKIKEVPVRWKDKATSNVKIFKDGSRMFLDLLNIRMNDNKGKYNNVIKK